MLEIVVSSEGDAFRVVYTARLGDSVYVLHAATPQREIDLVKQRLAAAEKDYRERQN